VIVVQGRPASRTFSFATTIAERAVDLIVVIGFTLLAVKFVPDAPEWLERAAIILGAGSVMAIVAVAIGIRALRSNWLARVRVWHSSRPRQRHFVDQVIAGFSPLTDKRVLASFMAATAIVWSAEATALVVVGHGMNLDLGFLEAFALLGALGLASAAPSTPGYVGIFQLVAVSILPLFAIGRSDAIAFIVLCQLLLYVATGVWGGIGLARLGVSLRTGRPESQ
jgi:uncharacterized membrane protein YbhN (UPF0104 family)